MRRPLLLLLIAVSCGPSAPKANSPRNRMTPKDIVQQSTEAIVRIEAGGDKVGTGFILDKNGLVVTNLHVVRGEAVIKVKLHDNSQFLVVEVAAYDEGRDLALLRIRSPKAFPTLRLGDSDQMSAGDSVIAIGNPLGVFDYSVSSGLVSQVRPVCGADDARCPPGGLTLLQISAPISQGSSGGPLFNQFGEVVGVTTLIVTQGQSINFAVPANYIKPLVAKPGAIAMEKFAEQTKLEDERPPEDNVRIQKMVPNHPVALLDGCNDKAIGEVIDSISSAIDIGAPLYNKGDIEACYRIYEGTSVKLERDPPCPGVGKAFGDGLLRATSLASYKEKAWALRDTFDGLIDVAQRRGFKPGANKP